MPQHPLAYTIRTATSADEPILWDMLFYAANMAADGATSSAAARSHPFLAEFVAGWGRPGDLGVLAIDSADDAALGAAWLRQLSEPGKRYAAVAEGTPELAIAVVPAAIGQGIGGALLDALLAQARGRHPAVALTVRENNPAIRLYKRHGFVVVDTITNRVGSRSFVMRAELRTTDDRR
ncbi:MAG: GNAT family N-acetyltransferase [Roseiflexaceae bacterium]